MSIATEISRLQTAKANLKTSIENKGVTVGDVTLDEYYTKVDAIPSSPTPTTIKSKCFVVTLTQDYTSGNVTLVSGDTDLAQHRSDTSFLISMNALNTASVAQQTRCFFTGNVKHVSTDITPVYYGAVLNCNGTTGKISTASVSYNVTNTNSNNPVYINSSGDIIFRATTTRTLLTGKYIIIAGWE